MLIPLYQTTLDIFFREATPNVTNWLTSLLKLPEFVSRIGKVEFPECSIDRPHTDLNGEVKAINLTEPNVCKSESIAE